MKRFSKSTYSAAILTLVLVTFSCSEDINTIGGDIIGTPNFEFDLLDNSTVIAYSRRVNPVQTNNLPVYQLGVYNDPVYGITEANILSQLTMNTPSPSFGSNPNIENVVLSIPYFSTSQGDGTFKLDSIFGNSPIKLSIYESKYYLRDYDPATNFDEGQKYYSDQGPLFENFLGELIYQTPDPFMPSNEGVVINEGTDDEETLSPRLRIVLPNDLFEEKILQAEGSDALLTNSNFKNHFRGLYFKVEAINNDGTTILLNMNQADIAINYTRDNTEPVEDRVESTFRLSFGGITVNAINHNFPAFIDQALANTNTTGEEKLYLKGGPGAISIIELFGPDLDNDGIADQLSDLRARKLLINDAHLILQVDQEVVTGGEREPERLYIYDLDNNKLLLDYVLDIQPNVSAFNFKTNHLGRLERNSSGEGTSYKIRLTNHISDLINKDSTNVRLGISISQNVNVVTFNELQTTTSPGFKKVPAGSVISPEGTVLHGSNAPNPEKRIKLNIYYTEINN